MIWTADSVPQADHDIKSVDDDGGDLWVEVKATTGRDSQFRWPAAEFQLAIRARKRYVLYRVYEAATTTLSYRVIRDPVGSFDTGELRLQPRICISGILFRDCERLGIWSPRLSRPPFVP
jgi:hypothetical protein